MFLQIMSSLRDVKESLLTKLRQATPRRVPTSSRYGFATPSPLLKSFAALLTVAAVLTVHHRPGARSATT